MTNRILDFLAEAEPELHDYLAQQEVAIALGCEYCGRRLLESDQIVDASVECLPLKKIENVHAREGMEIRIIYEGENDIVGMPVCSNCHAALTGTPR
jgi:hypothetical protein